MVKVASFHDPEGGQMICRTCMPLFLIHKAAISTWSGRVFHSFRGTMVFISNHILAYGS